MLPTAEAAGRHIYDVDRELRSGIYASERPGCGVEDDAQVEEMNDDDYLELTAGGLAITRDIISFSSPADIMPTS